MGYGFFDGAAITNYTNELAEAVDEIIKGEYMMIRQVLLRHYVYSYWIVNEFMLT